MNNKRFQITPACYLILVKDKKILLLRRFNTGYEDGNYSLIAGHLDGGESFRKAMAREAREEAGITIRKDDLKIAHVMHRSRKSSDSERIDMFFSIDKWKGELKNMEPDKCDDLSWFPINKLPSNTIPYIKQVIENLLHNTMYSEFEF